MTEKDYAGLCYLDGLNANIYLDLGWTFNFILFFSFLFF